MMYLRPSPSRALYALLLTIALILTPSQIQAAAKKPILLTVAVESEPNQLDPHIHNSWNTFRILTHMFESFVAEDLTRADVPKPPIVPALAESWEVSPDGLVYTFKLRQGVKFHDGTPWNAQAAKFNLDRMIDPKFKYANTIAITKLRWVWGDVAKYEALDDSTFRITLKQPNSEFLERLAQGGVGAPVMISPASVEKYGNDAITNHPVGTGPFRFEERVYGEKVVLAKNPEYWNPKRMPKVDRILFRGISEIASRELALMSGEFDIIGTPSPDSVSTLEAAGFRILKTPSPTIYLLWLNFDEPYMKDKRVRQAFAHAIDRKGMAESLKRGLAEPSYGILNFGGPGFDPAFRDYEYNPEKAKQLLAEAGYPNGIKTRMDWTLGGGSDVNTTADAEWLQRDLAKVGIEATIELFDNNTYWDMLAKGMRPGTSMMSVSWGETTMFWLDLVVRESAIAPNGYNVGKYRNPQVDKLLDSALRSKSVAERDAHLAELNKLIADDAALLTYYTAMQSYAVSPRIKEFVVAPQHWQDFTTVVKE